MGIKGLLRALGPLLVAPEGSSTAERDDGTRHARASDASSCSFPAARRRRREGGGGGGGTHHIRQFAGRRLAVDASAWLHRGAYSCCSQLVEALESSHPPTCDEGTPSCVARYTGYVTNRCGELLLGAGVASVHLVFDGKRCPLKAGTNEERDRRRAAALKEARKLKGLGRNREAEEKYKMCIKVTTGMERRVAEAVQRKWGRSGSGKQLKVTCVFSPYEADAQLAALCRDGVVDAVVTEDSDVLVYSAAIGVPFPIIYKLDRDSGDCDVLTMDWLLSPNPSNSSNDPLADLRRYLPCQAARQKGDNKGRRDSSSKGERSGSFLSSLRCLSRREILRPGAGVRLFIQACVLSGCDYAPSRMTGVGHVGAFKMVVENAHRKDGERFLRVLRSLPKGTVRGKETGTGSGSSALTSENNSGEQHQSLAEGNEIISAYERELAQSEAVFYYHRVLQMSSSSVVSLLNPPTASSSSSNIDRSGHLPCPERFENDLSFVGTFCVEDEPLFPGSSTNGSMSFFAKKGRASEQRRTVKSTSSFNNSEHTRAAGKAALQGAKDLFSNLERERESAISSIARMVSDRASAAYEMWPSSEQEKRTRLPPTKQVTARKVRRTNPFAQFSHGSGTSAPKVIQNVTQQENRSADGQNQYRGKEKESAVSCLVQTAPRFNCTDGVVDSSKNCVASPVSLNSRRVTVEAGNSNVSDQSDSCSVNRTKTAATGNEHILGDESNSDEEISEDSKKLGVSSPASEHTTSRYFSKGSGCSVSRKVSLEKSSDISLINGNGSGMPQGGANGVSGTTGREEENPSQLPNKVSCASSPPGSSQEYIAPDDLLEAVISEGSKEQPFVLDSDDEHIEECGVGAGTVERNVLPQHQRERLGTTANEISVQEEHYISPFQSSQLARRVTPTSSAKKRSMQRKASPLMAGFARQRELSIRSETFLESANLPPSFKLGAQAKSDSFAGISKKRKQNSSTINKFFQPLSTRQRQF